MPQTSSQGPPAVPCSEQHSSQFLPNQRRGTICTFIVFDGNYILDIQLVQAKCFLTPLNIFSIWPSVMWNAWTSNWISILCWKTHCYIHKHNLCTINWKLLRQLKHNEQQTTQERKLQAWKQEDGKQERQAVRLYDVEYEICNWQPTHSTQIMLSQMARLTYPFSWIYEMGSEVHE